ncbi:MAG TPA: hypothetical protein VKY26_05635 [Actinomycetota bacterium]|nr:hypothetical protein [Actinomycetota bacterium]
MGGWLAAAAALTLAACGKSTPTSTGSSSSPNADVTVKTASVPGVGTVLVNGNGRTLYILTSEAGGKITCTDASGCTRVWPDTELPAGMSAGIAGGGIEASLFSTVKDASGSLYLTYAGFPLYTYSGDNGSGTANGQNITSFGGTWETMNPDGTPVTGAASTTSSTGNGYSGY